MGWVRSNNCYFAVFSVYIINAASIKFEMQSVFHLESNYMTVHVLIRIRSFLPFYFRCNTASLAVFKEMHFLSTFIFDLEIILDHLIFINRQLFIYPHCWNDEPLFNYCIDPLNPLRIMVFFAAIFSFRTGLNS